MKKPTPYKAQAGYLPSPHRDVRQYSHKTYTFVWLYNSYSGETKQLRKEWRQATWRPFRPEELDIPEKVSLTQELHFKGLWPLDKVALFLLIPYETASKYAGYVDVNTKGVEDA